MTVDARPLAVHTVPGIALRASLIGIVVAFVLVLQAWPSWQEGVRREYASDIQEYEKIAVAAPGLPNQDLPLQHAERFPLHWLVGSIADLLDAPLHDVYRVATVLLLIALLAVVDMTLTALRLDLVTHGLSVLAVGASAYPVRYLLAAPGMLSDAAFVLALAIVALGVVRTSSAAVVGGAVFATVARGETALPLAIVVAGWLWLIGRRRWAALALIAPAVVFAAVHVVANGFAQPDNAALSEILVLGSLGHPGTLAAHVGRTLIGVLAPLTLVVAAYVRSRSMLPRMLLATTAAVLLQPLVLGPDWTDGTEPRLAGLALPALVVVGAILLRTAPLSARAAVVVALGLAAASLHHIYSDAGLDTSREWAIVSCVGAGAIAVALMWPRIRAIRA